jgi:hypothetical protein
MAFNVPREIALGTVGRFRGLQADNQPQNISDAIAKGAPERKLRNTLLESIGKDIVLRYPELSIY